MAAVTVGDISQEAIGDFWRWNDYISSGSHLKGLNYALEGNIKVPVKSKLNLFTLLAHITSLVVNN